MINLNAEERRIVKLHLDSEGLPHRLYICVSCYRDRLKARAVPEIFQAP